MTRKTLVIVGAGFCGSVLAAILLRRPPQGATDIVLVERGSAMGRGVAYAVRDFPYLLNVPAARLSADSRDPLQFLRFARRQHPDADGEDFLPRALYGDYLQDVLMQAESAASERARLLRVFGEVRHVTPCSADTPLAVEFSDRAPILAHRVVLALGNPPPALPPWATAIREHPGYCNDPWEMPRTLMPEHSVLIVGNGLTMADAAVALSEDPARTPVIHTISRRGLVSLPQGTFRPSALRGDGEALLACSESLTRVLSVARDLARAVEQRGGDWREVVTFIRHLAPALWRRFPLSERRRFLRHLQAHWYIHRHRLPPQLGAHIVSLRRAGKLNVNAGRIESGYATGNQLRVLWRPRGGNSIAVLTVDAIINATGPDYAVDRGAVPLLNSLCAIGLVSPDALNLGLRTAEHGACVDSEGRPSETLYYLGPMLRAEHWEATAATELRDHAEKLAQHLMNDLERVDRREPVDRCH